ncbi:MAG: hypothetical protein QW192_02695 [Candidatus Caldarchaeum sp.]
MMDLVYHFHHGRYVFPFSGFGSFFGYILVRAAELLSDKYGSDRFVIGFVFLSVLTYTPEWTVVAISALRGVVEISVGDIFGSNIVNISLVAGIAFLYAKKTLALTPSLTKSLGELLYLLALIPHVVLYFGTTSRLRGVVLTVFFVGYVALAHSFSKSVTSVHHKHHVRALFLSPSFWLARQG